MARLPPPRLSRPAADIVRRLASLALARLAIDRAVIEAVACSLQRAFQYAGRSGRSHQVAVGYGLSFQLVSTS
ncbi:hypothetical protein BOSEA31B_11498 [Hyphomicrobiales bacterium]|nr:hypothetical protein BOSEA31B_11498 [Hyphomicrobiales bacterium]CAH1697294.1 hypothetical protein BOSEA1005_10331 [Hyphomicrobiales bacterium]CAI0343800.1 hypothetical protein BO1005MUT1_20002 [Hyphomicrobiales bacterium]